MRLKSFHAKTMSEAMQMVRDTLGDDAVILATREERGGSVHVTAAIDPAFELGNGGTQAAEGDEWLQYDDEEDSGQIAEELTETLLRHNVPEDVIDHIISCATVVGLQNPEAAMIASIEHLFTFTPLPRTAFSKPVVMMGPPGSGKTIAVAKAATRGIMDGLKVCMITCDTVRAGGAEQLGAFTKLLRTDLHRASSAAELKTILQSLRGYDQVYIDMPGINPFDTDGIRGLAKLVGAANGVNVCVMPAGLDPDECADMAKIFSTLGASLLMPTRMDVARRFGGLFAAAHSGSMAFCDAGITPKVADGLVTLTPESLTHKIMPSLKSQGHSSQSKKTGTGH